MTAKQTLFVTEYLKDLNATQAAIRAGYSKDTAYSIGQENLNKPEISDAISQYLDRLMAENKSAIKAKIIDSLKQLAFDDLEVDVHVDKDGNPIGVRRNDRLKALELLGKYAALFTENVNINAHIETHTVTTEDLEKQIQEEIPRTE